MQIKSNKFYFRILLVIILSLSAPGVLTAFGPGYEQCKKDSLILRGKLTMQKSGGCIYIFLIDEEHFEVPNSGLDTIIVEPGSKELEFEFRELEPGEYALRIFQDLNKNKQLDKGLFGPKEPWALSWRSEKRFPPRFYDISFTLAGDKYMELNLSK